MALRLAVIGAALVVGGFINVTGFGRVTVPLGIAVLIAGGVTYFVQRRQVRK
jgi:hypothetical protein